MASKVIAFIPVRGGSKSIPLKNIKSLCGKPLVCWNIEALEKSQLVDEIIIATDSQLIKETVNSKNYTKVKIYDRDPKNAQDNASTESVMLEYITKNKLKEDEIFMLVQATSPLTQTIHFDEALNKYVNSKYDSMLSCVRNFRFFWNDKGQSINYDYNNRPRRQDYDGNLMENGAFYINTVKNIITNKNRLSGKIGIYEMPEYTGAEIDEEDDWIYIEKLIQKYVIKKDISNDYYKIKALFTDVDGVLTDGGMYYSENGDELKKFNTRDGMAFQLLREHGIKVGIITSENTNIVERRAKKLKADFLVQGKAFSGKFEELEKICKLNNLKLSEIAYVGDDINCVNILENVGFAFCPIDACDKVKKIKDICIINLKGGQAVIRKVTELILNQNDNLDGNR